MQDPLLRVLLLQLRGQLGLADLALEVALGVLDVQGAHELLGDRRAALHVLARADVLDAGADDRRVVDALVAVEALVLDRDHRAAHRRRHVPPWDRRADLVGLHVAQPRAVGGVDHRALALLVRLQLAQVGSGARHGDHVAGDRQQGQSAMASAITVEPQRDPPPAAPAAAPASCLSLPVGHRCSGSPVPGTPARPRAWVA